MSAPAHVLVLRPIIERLRERGHAVEITSRDYAQTQALLEKRGFRVQTIDVSELQKAEAGVTCTSLIFSTDHPQIHAD